MVSIECNLDRGISLVINKNLRLFLTLILLVVGIYYLTKISNLRSQREVLLAKHFAMESSQIPLDGEWTWQNKRWSFYYDVKSVINKNTVWFILRSKDINSEPSQFSYNLIQLKSGQTGIQAPEFMKLDQTSKPKFEIRKISSTQEALFFTEKNCQNDFCAETLKVYSLDSAELKEIGNIPLSASNLLNCKKLKTPCFEYYGRYSLDKTNKNNHNDIKVIFKGFEEDMNGQMKEISSENYHFENGKYISESLKKYH